MSKPAVYIETTILSYLTARPASDPIILGHQQATYEWWGQRRGDFELFVSQVVLDEIAQGDPAYAIKRAELAKPLIVLATPPTIAELVDRLVSSGPLPPKARADALHLAIAAGNGMDYLLTWNCKHLANAEILPKAAIIVEAAGYAMPFVCTPDELMGG